MEILRPLQNTSYVAFFAGFAGLIFVGTPGDVKISFEIVGVSKTSRYVQ